MTGRQNKSDDAFGYSEWKHSHHTSSSAKESPSDTSATLVPGVQCQDLKLPLQLLCMVIIWILFQLKWTLTVRTQLTEEVPFLFLL